MSREPQPGESVPNDRGLQSRQRGQDQRGQQQQGQQQRGLQPTLRIIDRCWFVYLILFGVTGALGIPLLWVSRGFTPRGRIIVSVIVSLYTLVLIGIAAASLYFAWQALQQLSGSS